MNEDTVGNIDETRIHAFEEAWVAGTPTPIEQFLPEASAESYLPTLEELVQVELEFTWKKSDRGGSGDSVDDTAADSRFLEHYLDRFAALNQLPVVRRLLRQEYHVRNVHGDRPLVEEYCRRFPSIFSDVEQAKDVLSGESRDIEQQSRGRYQLVSRHARGGFGEVWRAEDPLLGREVALKQLSNSAASQAEVRRRFIAEAQTTARLEHPGIVPVYDLVESDSAPPSYTMRFFSGRTFSEAIENFHSLPAGDPRKAIVNLRLTNAFLNICRTIQFAHARNFIHRDLKPQNVILGEFGETIVVDWGLAKNLDAASISARQPESEPGSGNQTIIGSVLGTPAYMAPEQFAGRNEEVDQRSDVYALGGILYELLYGKPPHRKIDVAGGTRDAVVLPHATSVPRSKQLAAICRKALAESKADRYDSATGLTRDLENYLADEPVSALAESFVGKSLRWLRKHRTVAIAGSLATLAVALALAAVLAVVLRTNEKLQVANVAVSQANRELKIANKETTEALDKSEASLYFQRLVSAHNELIDNSNVVQAKAILELCPDSRKSWEWHFIDNLCARDQHAVLSGHPGRIRQVAFNATDTRIATVDDSGEFRVWDANTLKMIWQGMHEGGASSIAFHPNGKQLVTAGKDREGKGKVRIWDAESGQLGRDLAAHDSLVWDVIFHPQDPVMATAGKDETIKLWDSNTFELKETLTGHTDDVLTIAFNHDGSQIVSGSKDRSVRVWDVAEAKIHHVFSGHGGAVRGVTFRPDGEYIASASEDHTVRTWDLEDKEPRHVLVGHRDDVYSVAYADDGIRLFSAGFDSGIFIWHSRTRELLQMLRGHESHVRHLKLSKDNQKLISAGDDKTARVWELQQNRVDPKFSGFLVAFHPSGKRIATGVARTSRQSEIRIYDVESQQELKRFPIAAGLLDLQYDKDGKRIGFTRRDGKTTLLDPKSGDVVAELPGNGPVMRLAFSPISDDVAVGDYGGNVRLWTPGEQDKVKNLGLHGKGVGAIRFTPDGKTLLTGSLDHVAKSWNLTTGRQSHIFAGHRDLITHIAVHPDGKTMATSSFDGTIKTWDLETGDETNSLVAGKFYLNCVEYSPDGSRLVAGSDQLIKLWDTKTNEQVFSRWGHNCINELVFSPDGLWLAIAGSHKGVRLWRGVAMQD